MEIKKYDRCLKCNRPLKTIKAQMRGFGDHCWKLHQIEVKRNKSSLFK